MNKNDKPSGDREKLIKWRLENMIEMVKNVRDRGIISKLANEDKYIRIGGEQFMGVSLADKSPLTGYGKKAKSIETIQNNFENKKPRELSEKTWDSKKERRLQAWLIRQALVNNRSLLEPLNLASHFDELLFCLDEVSLGDRNHEVPPTDDAQTKRPNVVRCDILAVGRQGETYFPVLIELKCNRELGRLNDQLNNFIFDIEEHQSINDVFITLMKACSGVSENKSFENNFKKVLIWPKCTSPQRSTTSKLISGNILQIEYSYSTENHNDINKWTFEAS